VRLVVGVQEARRRSGCHVEERLRFCQSSSFLFDPVNQRIMYGLQTFFNKVEQRFQREKIFWKEDVVTFRAYGPRD
jgi:hypothetical protein